MNYLSDENCTFVSDIKIALVFPLGIVREFRRAHMSGQMKKYMKSIYENINSQGSLITARTWVNNQAPSRISCFRAFI